MTNDNDSSIWQVIMYNKVKAKKTQADGAHNIIFSLFLSHKGLSWIHKLYKDDTDAYQVSPLANSHLSAYICITNIKT
jgi:hypothetical protein